MKLVFLLLISLGGASLLPAQLRIETRGFGMEEWELRTLFEATMACFPKAENQEDPPVFVSRHSDGPIVLYQRTPRGEVAMRLDSGDRYYAQLIYQFAHEWAHIRADFQPVDHENKWLEETLCETASLFALRHLASHWKKQAPNEALKNYRKNLATYAASVMDTRESLTRQSAPAFYRQHRKSLRQSATERSINGAFANLILPLFEAEPRHWETLATIPREKGASLSQHFEQWRKSTPQKHHRFLRKLESLFLP